MPKYGSHFTKLNIASLHFLLNIKFSFIYVWKGLRREIVGYDIIKLFLAIVWNYSDLIYVEHTPGTHSNCEI